MPPDFRILLRIPKTERGFIYGVLLFVLTHHPYFARIKRITFKTRGNKRSTLDGKRTGHFQHGGEYPRRLSQLEWWNFLVCLYQQVAENLLATRERVQEIARAISERQIGIAWPRIVRRQFAGIEIELAHGKRRDFGIQRLAALAGFVQHRRQEFAGAARRFGRGDEIRLEPIVRLAVVVAWPRQLRQRFQRIDQRIETLRKKRGAEPFVPHRSRCFEQRRPAPQSKTHQQRRPFIYINANGIKLRAQRFKTA